MDRGALIQIVAHENRVIRRLALLQRPLARKLGRRHGRAWMSLLLWRLQQELVDLLMEAALTAWAQGWRSADRKVTADLARHQFDDRDTSLPKPPAAPAPPEDWLTAYRKTVDAAMGRYTEGIRRDVSDLVTKGAVEGWTQAEITEKIEKLVTGLTTWQAERIARTESMRLWNLGSFGRMSAVPEVVGYEYSVVLDSRTSHICRPLAGLKVRKEELLHLPPLHPSCRTVVTALYSFDDVPDDKYGNANAPESVPGFGAVPTVPNSVRLAASTPAAPAAPPPPPPPVVPPAPSTPPGGRKVSEAVGLVLRTPIKPQLQEGLDLIDSVHTDGQLPDLSVYGGNTMTDYAGYYRRYWNNAKPSYIRVMSHSNDPLLTLVHEVGHFLDHMGIGNTSGFASSNDALLKGWREAIEQSDAIDRWIDAWKAGGVVGPHPITGQTVVYPLGKKVFDYYLDPAELFARSYTQFVVYKSNDPDLRDRLNSNAVLDFGHGFTLRRQWEWTDFQPIADAFEELFKKMGWM